jgi:hypothetical protein
MPPVETSVVIEVEDSEETEDRQKCMTQSVIAAENNAKYHSDQMEANPYIVVTALSKWVVDKIPVDFKTEHHVDQISIDNRILSVDQTQDHKVMIKRRK